MKKNVILTATVCVMLICAILAPRAVENSVTQVQTTRIQKTTFSEDIYTSGVVEEIAKKDISVDLPLVTDEIYFQVGDTVKVNDIIADIDVDATTTALLNLAQSVAAIPSEYIEVLGNLNIDTNKLSGYIPKHLYSPADGVITSISLGKGTICTPKSTVATISSGNGIRLKLSVSELDAEKISNKDNVVFKAGATGDKKYVGTIDRIFPTANKTLIGTAQSTVVNMYVSIDHEKVPLKPGYSVTGVIKSPKISTAYVIPYECVMQDDNNTEYVYLVKDNKASRCNIQSGTELYDGIEVKSPDLSGQSIIVNPTDIKGPDTLIQIVES